MAHQKKIVVTKGRREKVKKEAKEEFVIYNTFRQLDIFEVIETLNNKTS